jgi:hypothetical protein
VAGAVAGDTIPMSGRVTGAFVTPTVAGDTGASVSVTVTV